MQKNYKYLNTISVLFVSVLLISNIVSTKIVDLKWFVFDGGTILFPLSYIFGDILTEIYGYRNSRRVIWLGLFCLLIMSLIITVVGLLPPAKDWPYQEAYSQILGLTPRIVIASIVAYFVGEFSNSFILAKLKIITNGRWLWLRTIGSTVVGEFFDSILFVVIAFVGVLPSGLLVSLIASNYIFKTLIEVFFTPLTYRIVKFLKKTEEEDYYDYKTSFNPF